MNLSTYIRQPTYVMMISVGDNGVWEIGMADKTMKFASIIVFFLIN